MAKEEKRPPKESDTEIGRFAKQSSLVIKRLDGQKAGVRGKFVFRTLRYELDGQIDLGARHVEPFQHRLTWEGKSVFELTMISGQQRSRAEFRFGEITQGVRVAILDMEPLASGVLVTGSADGDELVPFRSSGCGCSSKSAPSTRPVLAWKDASSTRPVTLALPAKMAPELEGLPGVMQQTVARMAGGVGLGDIIDIFTYGVCVLECLWEGLLCWLDTIGGPTGPIGPMACGVIFSACMTICKINRPF